ncbi:MAG: DUF1559 domain-containing protein [Phycisphaerae bacterium]|jgi:type II secretory pathway pseudopilin PulG
MRSIRAFSVIEMLVVTLIIILVAAIVTPSLGAVRQRARRMVCTSQLHQIGVALAAYQSANHYRMPPFAFSEALTPNLPASGHWGGPIQKDPTTVGLFFGPSASVNLWALTVESLLTPQALACPSSCFSRDSSVSLFTYTNKFSSYCMRFPLSGDLFAESPKLAGNSATRGLLAVYAGYHSGMRARDASDPLGSSKYPVPFVRTDSKYELEPSVCFVRSTFDPAQDAIVSDLFWWPKLAAPAPPAGKYRTFPREGSWCHGRDFNVLMGNGSVLSATDDKNVIAENCDNPAIDAGGANAYHSQQAERIWQFFDTESCP